LRGAEVTPEQLKALGLKPVSVFELEAIQCFVARCESIQAAWFVSRTEAGGCLLGLTLGDSAIGVTESSFAAALVAVTEMLRVHLAIAAEKHAKGAN
jgi:hypothetical protein